MELLILALLGAGAAAYFVSKNAADSAAGSTAAAIPSYVVRANWKGSPTAVSQIIPTTVKENGILQSALGSAYDHASVAVTGDKYVVTASLIQSAEGYAPGVLPVDPTSAAFAKAYTALGGPSHAAGVISLKDADAIVRAYAIGTAHPDPTSTSSADAILQLMPKTITIFIVPDASAASIAADGSDFAIIAAPND